MAREMQADRFGLRMAAVLTEGNAAFPHDISERLRVARQQALQRRKRPAVVPSPAAVVLQGGPAATLGRHPSGRGWWTTFGAAIPMAALVAGLVGIHYFQNESVAQETAEIDSALLLDELPPDAYADLGFVQFLKTASDQKP
jgi:hypothetical protein